MKFRTFGKMCTLWKEGYGDRETLRLGLCLVPVGQWLVLLLLAACFSSCKDDSKPVADVAVRVTVELDAVVAEVDQRFLSFAVDSSQIAGTEFWNEDPLTRVEQPEVPIEPYDFTRPRLSKLASALAPAFLRIGGTHADHLYYDFSQAPIDSPPEPYRGVLNRELWDPMADFARNNDLTLMFTVNAALGPRDTAGAWQPDQARLVMEYATSRNDPVEVWEFGNELNAYSLLHSFNLSPKQLGRDLEVFRDLRDSVAATSRIAAPSVAFWPALGEIVPYMEEAMANGGEFIDVVSWHYYPQQSLRCPLQSLLATPQTLQDPDNLDEVSVWASAVETLSLEHAPGAVIWLGETGNAQCGGTYGVSDRWASSFWWLDQLGLIARRGQQVVVRQTLSGADYGLLSDVSLEPRPDYWASLLWKRLMGTRVLNTTSDSPLLRAYSHCARDGGIAVLAINLSAENSVDVTLPGFPLRGWSTYQLEADSLDSTTLRLNGTTLEVNDDGSPPEFKAASNPWLVLAPRSIGFVLVEDGSGVCD